MASDGGIVGWIARLHPALALVAIICGMVAAQVAGYNAAIRFEPDVYPPDSIAYHAVVIALGIVLFMGYPVTIAIHLLRTRGAVTAVRPSWLAGAAVLLLTAHVTVMIFPDWPWRDGPGWMIASALTWLSALVGPLYIMWTAARGLVRAEAGQAVPLNRVMDTFVMFAALPLGIYFLQRRVRRLTTGGTAPQAE